MPRRGQLQGTAKGSRRHGSRCSDPIAQFALLHGSACGVGLTAGSSAQCEPVQGSAIVFVADKPPVPMTTAKAKITIRFIIWSSRNPGLCVLCVAVLRCTIVSQKWLHRGRSPPEKRSRAPHFRRP
jgi:hypothetical protein